MAELTSFSQANASVGDTFNSYVIAEVIDGPSGRYRWEDPLKKSGTLANAYEVGQLQWLTGVGLCRALDTAGNWEQVDATANEVFTGNVATSFSQANLSAGDAFGNYVVKTVINATTGKYIWASRVALTGAIEFKVTTTANGETFTIPITPNGADNFVIIWGDGTRTKSGTGGLTHTYATAGTYSISIIGTVLTTFAFNNAGDRLKVASIDTLNPGLIGTTSCSGMWRGCSNATTTFTSMNMTGVTTTANMFNGCTAGLFNISSLSLPSATVTTSMFANCRSALLPLSTLSMPVTTTATSMFSGCASGQFTFASLSLPAVTNANSMFANCRRGAFDISSISMPLCTTATSMFSGCASGKFTLDFASISFPELLNASSMFYQCSSADFLWSTLTMPKVTNVTRMFAESCISAVVGNSFYNATDIVMPLVQNAFGMFNACKGFTGVNGGAWVLPASCANAQYICSESGVGAIPFTVDPANTSIDLQAAFLGCKSLFEINLSLIPASANSIAFMFSGCEYAKTRATDESLNLPICVSANNAFSGCKNAEFATLTTINMPQCVSLSGAFEGCSSALLPLTSITTSSSGCSFQGTFYGCKNALLPLTSLSNVSAVVGMFSGCQSAILPLTSVSFSTGNIGANGDAFVGSLAMFDGCVSAQFGSITWTVPTNTNSGSMTVYLVGGSSDLTSTNISAANIDALLIELATKYTGPVPGVLKYRAKGGAHLDSNRSPAALTAISTLQGRGWTRSGTY